MRKIINIENVINQLAQTSLKDIGLVILVGIVLGYIFARLNLPIPAPSVIIGVVGILAIWLGYNLGVK